MTTSAASYRPFGRGSTLCPGRHFVSAEILGVAAMLISKYELVPVSRSWTLPVRYPSNLATNIYPPKNDIEVCMRTMPGMKDAALTIFIIE